MATCPLDAALPLAERPIELDPQFPEGHYIAGYIQLDRQEHERTTERLQRVVELSHRASWPVAGTHPRRTSPIR